MNLKAKGQIEKAQAWLKTLDDTTKNQKATISEVLLYIGIHAIVSLLIGIIYSLENEPTIK